MKGRHGAIAGIGDEADDDADIAAEVVAVDIHHLGQCQSCCSCCLYSPPSLAGQTYFLLLLLHLLHLLLLHSLR